MNNDIILKILGRDKELFLQDYKHSQEYLKNIISNSKIIVLGGAGSIGSSVVLELLKYNPFLLHIVDIDENNLVELVRNIRSSKVYNQSKFETFAIDISSSIFEKLVIDNNGYDIWMNFSALKHVRSEKDVYTLMRLIEVNVINTFTTINLAKISGAKKYFSVSTDKAANPINYMGASKRIMELVIGCSSNIDVTSARFGNVAFSNGSLLHGMTNRFNLKQPFVAPKDIKRFFLTPVEAARLSILATFISEPGNIYIPIINNSIIETDFMLIANNYLKYKGFNIKYVESEKEARDEIHNLIKDNKWPCYTFNSDTSGEKLRETFLSENEKIESTDLTEIGKINIANIENKNNIISFIESYNSLLNTNNLNHSMINSLIKILIKNFSHRDLGKNLDQKM